MAYNRLANPDPELAPLLAKLPPQPLGLSRAALEATRKYIETDVLAFTRKTLQPHLPPEEAIRVENHQVPVEDGEITVRTYSPAVDVHGHADATYPLLIWAHGGGWVLNSIEGDDYELRILSFELRLAIVSIGYRLAPEHPWPIPLDDTYAAIKWAVEHAADVRADPTKGFLLGGISAGAQLCGSAAHRVQRDTFFDNHPKPTGFVLGIPPMVHADAVPEEYKANFTSVEQNKDGPMLTKNMLYDTYELVQALPSDPEFSPLLYPLESFQKLSPIYLQICGLDPVRDCGMLYAEKAKAAGVPVRLDVYPGAPHGFHRPFYATNAARKYETDLRDGIKWLLSRSTPSTS